MTAQTRAVLKGVFETGDVPTGANFTDLIDSFVSLNDTAEQALSSKLKLATLHATTEVSTALVKTTGFVATKVTATNVTAQGITTSGMTVLNKATVAAVTAQNIATSALRVTFLTVSAIVTAQATASVLNDQNGTMALPSTAQGYFTVEICGQTMAVPYFTVA